MPKISELPEGITLTGDELIDVVQDGENVKIPLKTLLNAPREVSIANARWTLIKEDDGFYGAETTTQDTEIEVASEMPS